MNYYNKISFSGLRYIDPNDPLVPESAQKADADVGVLYHLPMFDIGFNVKNLLAFPYRGGNFMLENMRSFTGYLVFHTSEEAEVSLHPSIAVTALKDYFAGDFNIFMKIKQAAFIGATLSMWRAKDWISSDWGTFRYLKLHGGASIRNTADILLLYVPHNDYYYSNKVELMLRLKLGQHD